MDDMKLQDAGMLRNMLSSGLSMGFMSSLVNIGTLTLQTSINKLGQNIIIAHTAVRKISEIFMIVFSVFGQTMATYCGQNLGAGKIQRIRRGILLATGYTCIWCTLNIVTAYTIGDWLVWLVTGSENPGSGLQCNVISQGRYFVLLCDGGNLYCEMPWGWENVLYR